MNRLRENFTTRQDYRAGDLAPAEETQPHPTGLDWFNIAVWGALFCASGLAWWGIIAGLRAVWEMM